jgi:mannose-1-phosphate guanylyltransferase
MTSRDERLAANEELFRHVNERIVELTDKWGGELDLVCECANTDCTERIVLTLHEYEQLRQDAHLFALRAGHQIADVEDVVETNERYLVVRKHVTTHAQVEESDRRS